MCVCGHRRGLIGRVASLFSQSDAGRNHLTREHAQHSASLTLTCACTHSYNFGGEALHGVWATCVTDNITTPTHTASGRTLCPTQFPAPIHMSNSWNRDLWVAAADVASTEARALYNHNQLAATTGDGSACSRSLEGCLGLSYYTPNINLGLHSLTCSF